MRITLSSIEKGWGTVVNNRLHIVDVGGGKAERAAALLGVCAVSWGQKLDSCQGLPIVKLLF